MTLRPRKVVTPRSRNGFQVGTAGITGAAIFGTLAATGWVSGVTAKAYAEDEAAKQIEAERAAAQAQESSTPAEVVVVEMRRPHRTVVKTKVVEQVSGTQATTPGAGGTVTIRSSGGSQNTGSTGASGGGGQSNVPPPAPPAPAPAAPAPAPAPAAPAPAPSSGS